MERDKLGRFIKKFQNSGSIVTNESNNYNDESVIEINGIKYKIKSGANEAYNNRNNDYYSGTNSNNFKFNDQTINDWLQSDGKEYLEVDPLSYTPQVGRFININGYDYAFPKEIFNEFDASGQSEQEFFSGDGKKYLISDWLKDQSRRNLRRYDKGKPGLQNYSQEEIPAGTNDGSKKTPIRDFIGNALSKPLDKEKLANFLELTKYGTAAAINNKMAERSLETEKPFLQDVSESHRNIYGNYRAQVEGEQAAAQLRNMASKPITSDGSLQQQMMLESQLKGQEFINQGNAQDEQMIKQTRENAWSQEQNNQQQRQAAAMQNRQAMLMSDKNKAQIENTRDSAMQSMIIDPLLSSREQRLRNEAAEQQEAQDYYYEKMLPREVLTTFELEDPKEEEIRTLWINQGYEAVQSAIAAGTFSQEQVNSLSKKINDEILKRQMEYRGAFLNTTPNNPYAYWQGSPMPGLKKGGTIYKAKLVKRTRDNDRSAKSIESNKKIATKFLEKALNSLYTYNEVELIAKRKYQAGGNIPYVGATPVFATSQKGTPSLKKKEESEEGLGTKELLDLIMQTDGLPSDIDSILIDLKNFTLFESNDPFNLQSSSNITSKYVNMISKIKKAKANRDWYDKTLDKLTKDGILNEYAITSSGKLIGMNNEGDFQFFDPKTMDKQEFESEGYQLLTNSNLLDIRAKYLDAAFNHNMIMEAANGIGIPQITEFITKTIQSLGSDKTQNQVYGDQSKEVLEGLQQLQKAANEVGQDLSISQMYEANIMNETQLNQAKNALLYLWNTLPSNMQSLLLVKGNGEKGAFDLITSLVNSKLSNNYKLEFSPKDKKSGSKSGSGSGENDKYFNHVFRAAMGLGRNEDFIINPGTTNSFKVLGTTIPIMESSSAMLKKDLLSDVKSSTVGQMLMTTDMSIAGQHVDSSAANKIYLTDRRITLVDLPYTYDPDSNTIIPDYELLSQKDQVDEYITNNKLSFENDFQQIQKFINDNNLTIKYNKQGEVQFPNVKRFALFNANFPEDIFADGEIKNGKYIKILNDKDAINTYTSIMQQNNWTKKDWDYDVEGWLSDDMYKGTVAVLIDDTFLNLVNKDLDSETVLELGQIDQQNKAREDFNYDTRQLGQ